MFSRTEIDALRTDIENTADLLERAMKLAGVITSLFRERGVSLVVVGGSSVEFFTEGGYMSGDIDFCRRSLQGPSLRMIKELLEPLGGRCMGRNWVVCGLAVDILGIIENESEKPYRELETPYGKVFLIPPELALVERTFYAMDSEECVPAARQMMAAALADGDFDWSEAERLADLPSFKILPELRKLKSELEAVGGKTAE